MYQEIRFRSLLFLVVGCVASTAFGEDPDGLHDRSWPRWRGPLATGVAPSGDPPIRWSESENVRWKIPIDGHGSSTPIVWGDQIFLTTAIDTGRVDPDLPPPDQQPDRPFGITYPNTFYQYVVLCIDRESGQERWRRIASESVPAEGHHNDNSYASSSPTTDGQRLYVWFGSAGLYCYDLDGNPLWSRDLGKATTRLSFGEAASPVIHDGKLIVTRDQEEQSYIVVLDAKTGETLWRDERDEPSGWSTPIVVNIDGVDQLITNGKIRVRSYDLESGELIWQCGGQASNVTPSPVASEDTVYCMSGYRGSALFALPLNKTGDLTDTDAIRWSKQRATPYVPSPLLYDGLLYYTQSNNAILSCADAETGELYISQQRLPGLRALYASPVAAAGRVYLAGRRGTTLVIEHGRQFKVLAENQLEEGTDASPAIAGNELYLRGSKHLYCIAKPEA